MAEALSARASWKGLLITSTTGGVGQKEPAGGGVAFTFSAHAYGSTQRFPLLNNRIWDPYFRYHPLYGTQMAEICQKCGRNLALVGRIHNCSLIDPGLLREASRQDRLSGLVGDVVNTEPVVNTVVNKRGKYPNTEKRRAYMKSYMAKRRNKFQKGLD
jgi:hypothetical protein